MLPLPRSQARIRAPRHAGSSSRGQKGGGAEVLALGRMVVQRAEDYTAASDALLRAQRAQSRVLELAEQKLTELDEVLKREAKEEETRVKEEEARVKVKTLRVRFATRDDQAAEEGAGASAGELSDGGEDPPEVAESSSSAPARPAKNDPAPDADGYYPCSAPGCALVFASLTQYHLHQSACHSAPLPADLGVSPTAPLDPLRQDWWGHLFRRGKDGGRFHKANGSDTREIDPRTAPERWRSRFSEEELLAQQERADAARLLSDEELAEHLQAIEDARAAEQAARKERRLEEKASRDDAINQALRIAGWQCPNCLKWNLSFPQLCFRCSTRLRLAEVVSRGIPDPRRAEGGRDDLSDTSQEALDFEIDVANQAMDLETLQPFLRNKRKRRGGKRRREEATYGKGRDACSDWSEARGKGKGQQNGQGQREAQRQRQVLVGSLCRGHHCRA